MHVATVSLDEVWEIYSLLPWLGAGTMLVFLFAAIRMWQTTPGQAERLMGIGFGLLTFAMVFEGAQQAGMILVNYYPGFDSEANPFADQSMDVAWWEPLVWWGDWAARLCGWGLAALGFVLAGRSLAREARRKDLQRLPRNRGHA